jgi:hypothetical protein
MPARLDDPRSLALALGATRTALGISILAATETALKAMLFGETNETGRAVARIVGARDLTLGAATLLAADRPRALRRLTATGGTLDAADTVALALAARQPATRAAGIGGVLFAGSAAALCAWTARRLA